MFKFPCVSISVLTFNSYLVHTTRSPSHIVINYFPVELYTTVGSMYIYSSALRPETRGTQIPGEAPNICGSSVWKLLHVAFLVSTTLRWFRNFLKISVLLS